MASQKDELRESRKRRLNWGIVISLVVLVTLLSVPSTEYFNIDRLVVGEPSPVTYRAEQTYRVIDRERTERKKHQLLRSVKPKFYVLTERQDQIIKNIIEKVESLRSGEKKLQGVSRYPDSKSAWNQLRQVVGSLCRFFVEQGIIKEKDFFKQFEHQDKAQLVVRTPGSNDRTTIVSLEQLRERLVALPNLPTRIQQMMGNLYPNFKFRNLAKKLLEDTLAPTISFDKRGFLREINQVKENFEPYYLTLKEGDLILQEGQTVKKSHIDLLKELNNRKVRFQFTNGISSLGIVLTALIFIYFYLREFEDNLFNEPNKLALMSVVVIIFVGISKAVKLLITGLPPSVEFALPFAAPIMIIALMVSESMAFIVTLFLSLLIVSFFGFSFELLVMFLVGGMTGILSIRRVDRRLTLLQSGILLGLVQSAVVIFFYGVRTESLLSGELGSMVLWGSVNGILFAPFMVLGILPFLENGFGITTNFRLLELADLNHPLLQELFQEAPGTFQHSIMLSNLCEQAARAIGANALLVRVGAYYHDLGKAETPDYFIENQSDGVNPHDELKPTLSASILKAHVKKGSEKAKEHGLPEEIIDLIEQHHGTTLMKSFYHEALTGDENVNKEEFQYPGPRPQSKEAGICMLGDAVEAATRALDNPTPKKIKDRTTELVHQKFTEGQLNECDLTLSDLNTIIETFTKVLSSVYHRRVEYPDEEETEQLEAEHPEVQEEN